MNRIVVLGILVTVALSHVASENLISENGNIFYIEPEYAFNWFEALQQCTRKNMSLISVDSFNKHLEIYNLLKSKYPHVSEPRLWIGGHDHAVYGRYEWVATGRSIGFSNWALGEPNDEDNTEHCVTTWAQGLAWNDAPCTSKLGFICEENQALVQLKRALNTTSLELNKLQMYSEAQALQELEELKKSYETQAKELKQLQEELDQLKADNEELDSLKTSAEIQAAQLRRTQEELRLLKLVKEEEDDAWGTSSELPTPETPLELVSTQTSCLTNDLLSQAVAILEMLKKSHEEQANLLKQKTEELKALEKANANEKLGVQVSTGSAGILDTQTNGTVANRYYNFVVNLNENPK